MAHAGMEPRPNSAYLDAPGGQLSQGDIFEDAPMWRLPDDPSDDVLVVAGSLMLLTPSCMIDKPLGNPRSLQVAPVVPVDTLGVSAGLADLMRESDCHHPVMYLPEEAYRPERAVLLYRAQSMPLAILERAGKDSRLTYEATQQLMRKLTLYWTGAHFARTAFRPPEDDF